MKKVYLFLTISMLVVSILSAQSPQSFKYQAIARDEAGNILSNWDIGIRIHIIKGGQEGRLVYSEKHLVVSSQYGMINLTIGNGRVVDGVFETIDWGSDRHYIKMEMDINGNEDYKEMGTTQLYAVPYALYAEEAGKLREQQDQSKSSSSSEDKTGSRSSQTGKQGGSRNGDPNTKLPATGNSYLNATSGNVGVGTNSPTEKLDVNGNIKTNGSIIADEGFLLMDSKGNPRKALLNPDGTWTSQFNCEGYIRDIRDGKQYNITKIGTQCWMAENLNAGTIIDGSINQADNSLIEKYCYGNLETKCDTFGGLYQWDEVMNWVITLGAQGICPESWHVPTDWEIKILEGNVDSDNGVGDSEWDGINWRGLDAGTKLKSTSGWYSPGGNGTDDFGFSVLPSGYLIGSTGMYYNITKIWYFWSSLESGSSALSRNLSYLFQEIRRAVTAKNNAFSLRCIKDFECGDSVTDQRDGEIYGTVKIGEQCWMSQNINVGSLIAGSIDQTPGTIEKYCLGDVESSCTTFGGLYQWEEAMNYSVIESAKGICPSGWHIPSENDWRLLEGAVDSQYPAGDVVWDGTGYRGFDAGKNLKSSSPPPTWTSNGYGTDKYDFTAFASGYMNVSAGIVYNMAIKGYFWTSLTSSSTMAWARTLINDEDGVGRNTESIDAGYSVRCVKDTP
jgi:uncharacterized protein (TIGR02145 family)